MMSNQQTLDDAHFWAAFKPRRERVRNEKDLCLFETLNWRELDAAGRRGKSQDELCAEYNRILGESFL